MKNKVHIIIFIIMTLVVTGCSNHNYDDMNKKNNEDSILENLTIEDEYKDCMTGPYQKDSLEEKFNALFTKYKNRDVSIYFTDIKNNYSYSLRPTMSFYSGSVVKAYVAIYLVEQARMGNIDLNDTYTYLSIDYKVDSPLTDQHHYNEQIPIKTLMEYFLKVSDNSAYYIIIRNIGTDAINEYFLNTYGIKLHFTSTHPFESGYNVQKANKLLELLYGLIQVDDEYTNIVKEALDNDFENSLNFDDIKFMHKFGEYDVYHNDIGIYDGDYPYLVSIFTLYGKGNYNDIINDISRELYEIYQDNLDSKEEYCQSITE